MEQQFARSDRVMVHDVAVTVGTDVAVIEKNLAIFDAGIAVLEIDSPIAKGLHLGSPQNNPRLEFFFDEIVVVGFPIGGYDFLLLVFLFGHELNNAFLHSFAATAYDAP